MKLRHVTAGLCAALFLSTGAFAQDAALLAKAKALQARIISIDTHVDIPFDFSTDAYDMMKPGVRGQQVHLPTMISGGYDAPFFIVYMGQGERTTVGYAKALSDAFLKFSAIHKLTDQLYPDKIELALTAADVRRIKASGKKIVIIGMENGYSMGKDIRLLDQFHDYGGRYFGLVHNGHNDLADSAQPNKSKNEPDEEWHGLSPLGKQVVKRLNELGIMVDVSHSSHKSTMDALALSATPIIASHSGVKGVSDHPRNLSDEALAAFKRTGGVVQLVAFDGYVKAVPAEKTAAIADLRKAMNIKPGDMDKLPPDTLKAYDAKMAEIDKKWPKANVANYVDHIDYAVKHMSIDNVGVSSDFNGGGGIDGFNSSGEAINVTVELLKRGYTEDQIGKIWGGNLLRVMEKAEQYAAGLKKGGK